MSLRFPVALLLAVGVTLGLFWAMQALIGVAGELQEGRPALSVDFVRLRRDTTPEVKKREPPNREKPAHPPPPPDISMSKASLDPGQGIGVPMSMDPSAALSEGIIGAGGADRDVVPLVRIEPEYPQRARQRSIEGWVAIEFTISRVGSVTDAVIIASNPPRIFDRNALQAVRKWKYNPKIENGAAVERPGIRVTLDFSMEN